MSSHAEVIEQSIKERDEARELAWSYLWDIRQRTIDWEWEKHYAADLAEHQWLQDRLSGLSTRDRQIWDERR